MRKSRACIGYLIEDLGLIGQDILYYRRWLWLWAWDKNIKLRWYRWRWRHGWIPADEFHPALEIDIGLMLVMNPEEYGQYQQEVMNWRQQVHDMNLKRRDQRLAE